MSNTGLKYVTSVVIDTTVGSGTWGNQNNIIGNNTTDGVNAYINGSAFGNISQYLVGIFSPGLGASDNIDGFIGAIRRHGSSSGVSYDNSVKMYKNGTVVGNDKASSNTYGSSGAYSADYGGAADKWGTSGTGADTWGLAFSTNVSDKHESVYCTAMRMNFYYTTSSGISYSTTITSASFTLTLYDAVTSFVDHILSGVKCLFNRRRR